MNLVLERWNASDAVAAAEEVLPCCGSRAWARGLSERRPLRDEAEVLAASDAVWWGLGEADWDEAFGTHPRIGERNATVAATERSLTWSNHEQSAVALDDRRIAEEMSAANRAYEAHFGRTFLVFASGKSAQEIVANMTARMKNEAPIELRESAEQQRLITRLRLERWMGET